MIVPSAIHTLNRIRVLNRTARPSCIPKPKPLLSFRPGYRCAHICIRHDHPPSTAGGIIYVQCARPTGTGAATSSVPVHIRLQRGPRLRFLVRRRLHASHRFAVHVKHLAAAHHGMPHRLSVMRHRSLLLLLHLLLPLRLHHRRSLLLFSCRRTLHGHTRLLHRPSPPSK
jgi:hypothetical protein